jgi:prevent-host-death family protein
MKTVSVLEAKNQLSKLIRTVRAGEQVVIANRGEPVARLTAVDAVSAGAARGTATAILELAQAHRPSPRKRSTREIDRAIADERAAWD